MKSTSLKLLLWVGGAAALLSAVGLLVVAPLVMARYGERPAAPAVSPSSAATSEITPSER